MPFQSKIRQRLHFAEGFLNIVFPEIPLAAAGRGAHRLRRPGLGDCQQAHVCRIAARRQTRIDNT